MVSKPPHHQGLNQLPYVALAGGILDKITTSFSIDHDSKEPPEVPLNTHVKLQPPSADEELDEERQRLYQSKVGSILYAAVMTRPDVSKAVTELSRFDHNPGIKHMTAADDCLRYLRHTRYSNATAMQRLEMIRRRGTQVRDTL